MISTQTKPHVTTLLTTWAMAIVTNVPTPMIAYMMEGTAVLYKRSSSPTRICFARTVPASPITLSLVKREKQESRHVNILVLCKKHKYF